MLLRFKKRTILFAGLVLLGAWFASSCGDGPEDDGDGPTPAGDSSASETAAAETALPTRSAEQLNDNLLNEARNVVFFVEVAGGLRKACESTPCNNSEVPVQNWQSALNRCSKMETFAAVKESGPDVYAKMYDGVLSTCEKIAETFPKLTTNTTPEEHKALAESALGSLPSLISGAEGYVG